MPRRLFLSILIAIALSCISIAGAQQDVLTQISTIDALLSGIYDGEVTLEVLKRSGDLGLGTFNTLDGEMVLMDGHFYRIAATGAVDSPALNTKTPFAAVTFFEPDRTIDLTSGMNFQRFTEEIDHALPTSNIFYAIKITGTFQSVKTRSVPRQEKPYTPLQEIVKTQPVFDLTDVQGTIVGFRCPPYVKGINVPGYHLHFLAADHKSGGHVLDFQVKTARVEIDETDRFLLVLPGDAPFYAADLSGDKEAEMKKVEK